MTAEPAEALSPTRSLLSRLRHSTDVVAALMRAELQAGAAYRAQLVLGIFGWVVPLAFMVLWRGAAETSDVSRITPGQFTTYFAVVLVTTNVSLSSPLINGFSGLVHSGQLSAMLLRPHHPLLTVSARAAAQRLYRLVPMFVVVPVLLVVGRGVVADDITQLILAPLVGALGVIASAYLAGLVATIAFWMTKASGIQGLLYALEWIAGGVIAPVLLLPGILPALLHHQPLWFAIGAPAEMVAGITSVRPTVLLEAMAWVATLHFLFARVWRHGVRRYEAVGT